MARCHSGAVELVALVAPGATVLPDHLPRFAEGMAGEVAVICADCHAVLSIGPREEVFSLI